MLLGQPALPWGPSELRWEEEQWDCGGHKVCTAHGDTLGLVPFLLLGGVQASSILTLLLPSSGTCTESQKW